MLTVQNCAMLCSVHTVGCRVAGDGLAAVAGPPDGGQPHLHRCRPGQPEVTPLCIALYCTVLTVSISTSPRCPPPSLSSCPTTWPGRPSPPTPLPSTLSSSVSSRWIFPVVFWLEFRWCGRSDRFGDYSEFWTWLSVCKSRALCCAGYRNQ